MAFYPQYALFSYRLTDPPELEQLEREKWDPIIAWAAQR